MNGMVKLKKRHNGRYDYYCNTNVSQNRSASFCVISFIKLKDGKIIAMDEY